MIVRSEQPPTSVAALASDRFARHRPVIVRWSVAAMLAAAYAALAVRAHVQMRTTGYDLGIFEQAVRSYAEGRPGLVPLKGPNFPQLGDHFSPVLVLLAPFYRLFPTPLTLLVAQALLLAVAVVPIMALAHRCVGAAASLVAGLGYGLSWGIAQTVGFDFHEVCFAVPLLAFALAALAERRLRAAALWSLPVTLVKEDLGLTVVVIGLLIAYFGALRLGLATSLAGLVATSVAVGVVIPALNPNDDYAYASMFAADAGHPGVKVLTLIALLAPTAGLALRSPLSLVAAPTLMWRFTSDNPAHWGTGHHYSAVLMPVIFVAFVDALRRWAPARPLAPVLVLSTAVTLALLGFFPPARLAASDTWRTDARVMAAHRILARIPDGATVTATNRLVPQLTSRATVTQFGLGRPTGEFIVVDTETTNWPLSLAAQRQQTQAAEAAGYHRIAEDHGFLLLRRT